MKPLPFVYSIKSEINLDTMQFAEYVKSKIIIYYRYSP